jgi:exodeoxyribonuclease VII small subunit
MEVNLSTTFEDALKELESIADSLEKGNMPLEDAVNSYERGVLLKKYCNNKLDEAKIRIEKITTSN